MALVVIIIILHMDWVLVAAFFTLSWLRMGKNRLKDKHLKDLNSYSNVILRGYINIADVAIDKSFHAIFTTMISAPPWHKLQEIHGAFFSD